jgi:hypothetical protein
LRRIYIEADELETEKRALVRGAGAHGRDLPGQCTWKELALIRNSIERRF